MAAVTACATLGYASFDLEAAVRRIAARGFRRVEITELGAYCNHLPYRRSDPAFVRDLLARHALAPVALNVSTSRMVDGKLVRILISDPRFTADIRAYVRWYVEAARVLGVRLISLPLGPRILDEAAWRDEIGRSCAVFRTIVAEAADAGVGVNLEVPHLFQLTDTVEHALAILDEIGHPSLGATVDTSHWGILRYDAPAFLRALGPRLKHVHLRDSQGGDTRDYRQALELTPGDGQADFRLFAATLDDLGYSGEAALELEHRHDDLDAIESQYSRALAHLEACGWKVPRTA